MAKDHRKLLGQALKSDASFEDFFQNELNSSTLSGTFNRYVKSSVYQCVECSYGILGILWFFS